MRDSRIGRSLPSVPLLAVALVALAMPAFTGCSQKKADNSPSMAKTVIDQATMATQPNAVEISNQALVYECAKCGTDYDKAGKCPADGTDLVAMQVSYICPADHQPADHAGKCPRCNMDVEIQKVALNGAGSP
jgi:Zn finger protein HypA/HybF involved in hydrogenase expression